MSDEFDPYFKWLGIPPDEQPANHYRLLGVPKFVDDPDVIENAADQRMMMLRTLQTGRQAALSQQMLNEISTARGTLLNSEKKTAYDDELRAADHSGSKREAEGVNSQVPTASLPAPWAEVTPRPSKRGSTSRLPATVAVAGGLVVLSAAAIVAGVFFLRGPNEPSGSEVDQPTGNSAGSEIVERSDSADGAGSPDLLADGTAIDLLARIDPARDAVKGEWKFMGGALVSPKLKHARLQIECVPPADYRVEIVLERIEGDEAFACGLVCVGRQFAATLDGWNGTKSLLQAVDRQWVNNESAKKIKVFKNSQRAEVVYTVRSDRITVAVDGQIAIDWKGDPQRLSLPSEFVIPGKQNLFVCCYDSVYHIHQMTLTPLSETPLPTP